MEAFYGPLILWAIQHWQKPGHSLHLALDTTVLWNRYCVVVLSVVCHGRAIPLLWQTLEHPSASVSAEMVIALLQQRPSLMIIEVPSASGVSPPLIVCIVRVNLLGSRAKNKDDR